VPLCRCIEVTNQQCEAMLVFAIMLAAETRPYAEAYSRLYVFDPMGQQVLNA